MNLGANDVHVWLVDLDDSALDALSSTLEHGELAKAASFATTRLQSHYRRCRGSLRTLLARYTGQAAAALRFEYGHQGKPSLAHADWHFNVAHSGARALVAIARAPVGVDLEATDRASVNPEELLPLVCTDAEATALRAMNASERHDAFYRLWTRKEAFCKGLGLGLQLDLPQVRTLRYSLHGSVQMHCEGITEDWFAYELPPIPGYAASLCLPHATAQVQFLAHTATHIP